MAARFSILAWRSPWTEARGGLQSTVSGRVGLTRFSKYNKRCGGWAKPSHRVCRGSATWGRQRDGSQRKGALEVFSESFRAYEFFTGFFC